MRRLWRAALARLQARCHARPASGVAGRAPGPQGTLDSTSVAFVCARVVRHACKRPKHRCCQPRCSIRCDPVRARACAGARHDGAGGVDDVAAGLAAGVHQVDRRQQQLLLQVRAAPDLVLGLAGLRARGTGYGRGYKSSSCLCRCAQRQISSLDLPACARAALGRGRRHQGSSCPCRCAQRPGPVLILACLHACIALHVAAVTTTTAPWSAGCCCMGTPLFLLHHPVLITDLRWEWHSLAAARLQQRRRQHACRPC